MSPSCLIQTQNLVKRFGYHLAVNDVSFEVCGGEVFGFLGPNGAGKTPNIKMIVGLLEGVGIGAVEIHPGGLKKALEDEIAGFGAGVPGIGLVDGANRGTVREGVGKSRGG